MTAQLRFEPLTGTIGAVVDGLDIDAGPSDAEVEAVHRGLMDRHVLFFRDQHPSPEALLAFARRFGPISPRHPLHLCVPGLEEVMVIVDDATKPPENDIWHSDLSGQPKPPFAGVLHGVELPAAGGDTMWCDMHAVYEALSPHMRAFLGGLTAVHDVAASGHVASLSTRASSATVTRCMTLPPASRVCAIGSMIAGRPSME